MASEGRWDELEASFGWGDEVDPDVVERILAADLSSFQEGIAAALREAVARAKESDTIKALYWEFDVDNDSNAVFLCEAYLPDLEWVGLFTDHVRGPELGVESLVGNDDVDVDFLLWGRVFGAFGRALESVQPRPEIPVAFSYHDGPVFYALLPAGAMSVADTPRSRIPEQISADSFYALGPIGSEVGVHPTLVLGDDVSWAMRQLFHWRNERTWSLRDEPTSPPPDVEGVTLGLSHGDFEDAITTHSASNWVASEQFTRRLVELVGGNTVTSTPVTVASPDGHERRPYFVLSPDQTVDPLWLTPDQRISRGLATAAAFRAEDVRGQSVLRVEVPFFWPGAAMFVSGEVLRRLAESNVLHGFAAQEQTIITERERSAAGIKHASTYT